MNPYALEDNNYHAIYVHDEIVLIVCSAVASSRWFVDRDNKVRSIVNIYRLQKCKMILVSEVDVLSVIGGVPVVPIEHFERWVLCSVYPGHYEMMEWDDKYYYRPENL